MPVINYSKIRQLETQHRWLQMRSGRKRESFLPVHATTNWFCSFSRSAADSGITKRDEFDSKNQIASAATRRLFISTVAWAWIYAVNCPFVSFYYFNLIRWRSPRRLATHKLQNLPRFDRSQGTDLLTDKSTLMTRARENYSVDDNKNPILPYHLRIASYGHSQVSHPTY